MSDWYYAKGGQQQGPVSLEQLQEIIRNGGIDPQVDLVWSAHMKDWQPAAQVEELGKFSPESSLRGLVQASGSDMQASGTSMRPAVSPVAGEIEPGSDPIGIIECISKGFELTKNNFGTILLVGLVYFGILMGVNIVLSLVNAAGSLLSGGHQDSGSELSVVMIGVSFIINIAFQVLSVYLGMGLTRVALNFVDGKPVEVTQLFGEGGKLLRAIGASILYGLGVLIGFIFLIVPGIYIAIRFGQYLNAIVDKDMGVFEAFEYSSRLTTNNKWRLIGLGILGGLIAMSGMLACGVGLIFTGPIAWLAWIVSYRWMQIGRRAATPAY